MEVFSAHLCDEAVFRGKSALNKSKRGMGACSSRGGSVGAGKYVEAVRVQDFAARKQQVLEKRMKMAKEVKAHLSPKGNLFPLVELEPWKHYSGDEIDAGEVLDSAFDDKSRLEIHIAMSGGISKIGKREFSWINSTVLSAKDKATNNVLATSIFVEHETRGGQVLELVWLATHRSHERKGIGGILFEWILILAGHMKVSAVLVTANTDVVGWWLSQGKKHSKQSSLQSTMLWKHSSSSKLPRSNLDDTTLNKMNVLLATAQLQDTPTSAVSSFYDSTKHLTKSAEPFRYDISNTVHMWFLIKVKERKKSTSSKSQTQHVNSKTKTKK